MHYTPLPQRGLLQLSGDDRSTFLQGLVSNDVRPVQQGQAVYAALLSPQGKFLHDFFLLPWPDAILIDIDKTRLPLLHQRLNLYKLRAKLQLAMLPETCGVLAAWDGSSPVLPAELGLCIADPRVPALGFRLVGEQAALADYAQAQGWQAATADDYERLRLQAGVPDGVADLIENKTLLLEAGFEALHGVDFAKGCYVGQEVTARSKYRGQVRKQFYRVSANADLPSPGTPVTLAGAPIGEMRSSLDMLGLALLNIEAVEKVLAGEGVLEAAGLTLAAAAPDYRHAAPA